MQKISLSSAYRVWVDSFCLSLSLRSLRFVALVQPRISASISRCQTDRRRCGVGGRLYKIDRVTRPCCQSAAAATTPLRASSGYTFLFLFILLFPARRDCYVLIHSLYPASSEWGVGGWHGRMRVVCGMYVSSSKGKLSHCLRDDVW